ncbi:dynamin-like protein, putative [Eimeria maxima]|uniref:Dynamin-like protein, putative n=1 Tax=Eimeria maxima TaxID=5804 RepID=U6M9T2_EIMMA|nr:dynamin-like protein, putative [Eimeria maxima]CDJ58415.1 dynamin-like protein, putative [Eimeria maxima]
MEHLNGPQMTSETASTASGDGGKLESQMYHQLRKLINVVDELRDCGVQQWIQLPRICVLGTQSAGKSSVLEAIVGVDFLPRGDGVVTRRPLELRLVHLPESEHGPEEAFAVFDNCKDRKFKNFDEVRSEIERLTDEVAGKNKGIVDSPIVLTVYATRCPDLSLIDLPGITRVPLKGSDQSDDIEALTRQMALRYAADPRTIILAVLPANADMSTSDALQLARRVDPRGVRTIGVITKVDLMDNGTDACKMLLGEEIPLRLGYTGVKNRSQADIKAGKSVQSCLEDERQYFKTHPVYGHMGSQYWGIPSLVEKLTRVLFLHIKHVLPEIRKEIQLKARGVQSRIQELGEGVPSESRDRAQLLWTAITDYVEVIKSAIRGKYDKRLQKYFDQDQCLTIGSCIRHEYTSLLDEYCDRNISDDITDSQVETAIRLHEGESLPGFPSPDTFEHLILPYLKKLSPPVMDCLDRVAQTLESLAQRVAERVFCRFPALAERVLEISQEILIREKEATREILQHDVDAEMGYLFTNDERYLQDHGTMITQQQLTLEQLQQQQQLLQQHQQMGIGPDGRPLQQPSHAERAQQMLQQVQNQMSTLWASKDKKKPVYSEQFIQEIRRRLDAYFGLVLHNVRDTVPKKIGFFLVRQLQDKLQFELYNKLNDEQLFSSLLGEPSHIVEERRSLMAQLSTLKKAAAVLQRDPQIAGKQNTDICFDVLLLLYFPLLRGAHACLSLSVAPSPWCALNFDTIDAMFDSDLRELQRGATAQQQLGSSPPSSGPQQRASLQQPQQQQMRQQQQPLRQQQGTGRVSNGPPPPSTQTGGPTGMPATGNNLLLPSQQPPAPAAATQDGRAAPNARHLFERPVMFQTASNPLFND